LNYNLKSKLIETIKNELIKVLFYFFNLDINNLNMPTYHIITTNVIIYYYNRNCDSWCCV